MADKTQPSEDIAKLLNSLGILDPAMDSAYLAAKEFFFRHPKIVKEDPLYERSIAAQTVVAYHERLSAACERVTRVEQELAEAKKYIAEPWKHSEHWLNPETGQVECECCCHRGGSTRLDE